MVKLRSQKSSSLYKRAKKILPGGVDSPVRSFKAVGRQPIFIQRGRGAHIEDVDGNSYIDYVMSWGPLIHGHAPPGLVETLQSALREGTSFGAPIELELKLGELVRRLVPSIEQIRFVSSGTEATMSALRLARAATDRNLVIKFEGCYHGHSDSFLVQAGSGATTFGTPTSPGVPESVANNTLVASYNDLDSVRQCFANNSNTIAAVIVEPIAGNMGIVTPANGFLEGLRELCNLHGSLLIFDEVISGFRVAKGGAQSLFNIQPDLTCLGKIIGGGLPVGAYGGRKDLMGLLSPNGPVYQAGTLSGNPLAMTAGLWSLQKLSPGLYRRLNQLGTKLANGFVDVGKKTGVPLQVNSIGSTLTPFFSEHPVTNYQSALLTDRDIYAKFFRGMLERGIYPPPSQFEAWFISSSHTTQNINQTIYAAQEVMHDLKN